MIMLRYRDQRIMSSCNV